MIFKQKDLQEGQVLTEEKWSKKRKMSVKNINKVGRFQQPPVKELPVELHSSPSSPEREEQDHIPRKATNGNQDDNLYKAERLSVSLL
jgi:hypothetical protein